jgi:hypothetical protein
MKTAVGALAKASNPRALIAVEAARSQRPPIDWSNYGRALSMGLDRQPRTVESQALTDEVAKRIERWEVTGRRKYARRNRRSRFVASVGRVLGDVLAAADTDVQRWAYHSMSKGAFTGLSVSYRDFLAIHEALQGLGLIEVLPGFYRRTSPFGDRSPEPHGKATRFEPRNG